MPIIMANKENENEKKKTFCSKKLLNNVLGVTETAFLTKRVMFHPLKKRGCFWMKDYFL